MYINQVKTKWYIITFFKSLLNLMMVSRVCISSLQLLHTFTLFTAMLFMVCPHKLVPKHTSEWVVMWFDVIDMWTFHMGRQWLMFRSVSVLYVCKYCMYVFMNLFCTHAYIIFMSYHILLTVHYKKKEKGVGLKKSFFSNFFLLLFEWCTWNVQRCLIILI